MRRSRQPELLPQRRDCSALIELPDDASVATCAVRKSPEGA